MLAPLRHDDDGRRNSCCPAVRGHGAQAYPGWPRSRYAAQCLGFCLSMCDICLHPRDGCGHGACMAYFTKRYHPPGLLSGTLIEHPAPQAGPLRLHLIDYTAEGVREQDDVTLTQCKVSLERDDITWIHARGNITAEVLRELGEAFGLHPLALEDVLNTGQRPKLEYYDLQLFMVMSLPVWRDDNLATEQVSLFMGERYLISFHQGQGDPFEPVRKRLTAAAGKMRARGADYLLYSLVDLIIDEGFPVLEDMGERIERLEEELLDQPNKRVLGEIHILKRDLLLLRRMLWPQREVLTQLMREDQTLIHEETMPYLRVCYYL